jgi:glycosyltransferase 2 family protein
MRSGRLVRSGARTAGYALVFAFLAYQVWRTRHGLAASLRTVGWATVMLAGGLAAVGGVPGMLGWYLLLTRLGSRMGFPAAVRVYFVAGLARYLPGGVWPVVAHAAMARPLGEPPARLAGAFIASQGLAIVAGMGVGVLTLPRLVAAEPLWWLLVPVFVAALVPLAAPRLLANLLGAGQRLLRRGARPLDLPDRRTLVATTGLMAAGWLISGAHIAVLAVALGADPAHAATVGVGGFALSVVAGAIAIVMPSGIGVREVVLGLTLATLLTGPALVTVVGLSRVLITVGDAVISAAVLAVLTHVGRDRLDATSS